MSFTHHVSPLCLWAHHPNIDIDRYGGVMLGPVRFTHIETCTREVCRAFLLQEEVQTCISTLRSLDDILASLRSELAEHTPKASSSEPGVNAASEASPAASRKPPDYAGLQTSLDLAKVKRLVTARENAIKSVKTLLQRAKDRQAKQTASSNTSLEGANS